jgi:hypothetical protein
VTRVYSPHFAWVSRFCGATLPFEETVGCDLNRERGTDGV